VPIWVQGQGWFLWLFGKKAQSNMFGCWLRAYVGRILENLEASFSGAATFWSFTILFL